MYQNCFTSLGESISALGAAGENATRRLAEQVDYQVAAVGDYIANNPIVLYVDGPVFRAAVTGLTEYARALMDNKINESSVGFNLVRSNMEIDFTTALNSAMDDINDQLTAVIINDADYVVKKEAFDVRIQTLTDNTVASATAIMDGLNNYITELRHSSGQTVSAMVDSHTFDRPLLRYTGVITFPSPLVLDDFNDFSIEFSNIGTVVWEGWLGLTIIDEYYKSFSYQASDRVYSIPAGESSTIVITPKIPKVIYVKGLPRNLGKQLKYTIHVNTRKVV